MGEVLLEVAGLDAFYGEVQVLRSVSLQVGRGEIISLIGPNGAGKTTLMKCIAGALGTKRGSVRFEGHPLEQLRANHVVARGVSLVPEGRRLFPGLTVRQNLLLGAYLRRDARVLADLDSVLQLFPELRARGQQLAATLSGGEQQMCAIGRALMAKPKVLLIDELSLGLAPVVVDRLAQVVKEISAGNGVSVLLVEQDVWTALTLADRAYVLEAGEIQLEGVAKDLMKNDRIRRAYLGI